MTTRRPHALARAATRAAALAGLALLAACASADPAYYTLNATAGTPLPGTHAIIEVRRPGLAGYLDRSDVVLKAADYTLAVNSQIRWAEPLGDMIGRVISQDVSQRLPTSSVFTQSGAISADPTLRLEVDITAFDQDATGQVVLDANMALERGTTHAPVVTRRIHLTAPAAGKDPAALAAALSGLLGQLADQVASDVRGREV